MRKLFFILGVLLVFSVYGQVPVPAKKSGKSKADNPTQAPEAMVRKTETFDILALVRVFKSWGYIDRTGNYAINLQFDNATSFSGGLACVKKMRDWGYIDTKGTYVINPQFERAENFSEGLARVVKFKNGDTLRNQEHLQ